jgi:thiamine phosphate synthase YjbQ (UPF0047 family)
MAFSVSTDDRLTTVDVTDRVASEIPAGVDGTATVFVRHTTAAVTVQEAESRLLGDLESFIADVVPDGGHAHDARGSTARNRGSHSLRSLRTALSMGTRTATSGRHSSGRA